MTGMAQTNLDFLRFPVACELESPISVNLPGVKAIGGAHLHNSIIRENSVIGIDGCIRRIFY